MGLKPRAKETKCCGLGTETGPIFDERVRQLERWNVTDRTLHVTVANWHSLHQPDEVLRTGDRDWANL